MFLFQSQFQGMAACRASANCPGPGIQLNISDIEGIEVAYFSHFDPNPHLGGDLCICVSVFVYLYLCICIFVFVYLYLCICICACREVEKAMCIKHRAPWGARPSALQSSFTKVFLLYLLERGTWIMCDSPGITIIP